MAQLEEGALDFNDPNTQLKIMGDWNWLEGKEYERTPRGGKIGDGGEEVSGSYLSKEEPRSEERRVGKECRSWWSSCH